MAYVQLKQNASASSEELLAYARQHIPERAALPKRIDIIDALPVTPVGKIFKPALLQIEIAKVIEHEAAQGGLGGVELDIRQDSRRGLVALIRAGANRQALEQRLGKFTFPIEWIN